MQRYNHDPRAYIFYQEGTEEKFAPRFCYVDSNRVDLLGAVWKYHPGLVAYVEEDHGLWIASVNVRINGTHTDRIVYPAGMLIDALEFQVILNDSREEEIVQRTRD